MQTRNKRRLLAALEGQLHRWAGGKDAARARQRVGMLIQSLREQARSPADSNFPRRLAELVAAAAGNEDRQTRNAYLQLARMDCLLWQIALNQHLDPAEPRSVESPQPTV